MFLNKYKDWNEEKCIEKVNGRNHRIILILNIFPELNNL